MKKKERNLMRLLLNSVFDNLTLQTKQHLYDHEMFQSNHRFHHFLFEDFYLYFERRRSKKRKENKEEEEEEEGEE